MEVTFTVDDIVAKVRELAAEFPDRTVLVGCSNIDQGDRKSCIVGLALQRLGVPPQWFIENQVPRANVNHVLRALNVTDRHANLAGMSWLIAVQAQQDSRARWSTAVQRADFVRAVGRTGHSHHLNTHWS